MKILGCDYDGTFNYGGIDETKLTAVQMWREAGHKIGIVSGRGPDMMRFLQEEYGLDLDFFVAFNGAVILDAYQREVYKTTCDDVDLTALTKDLFAWGCTFAHVNSNRYYLVYRDKENVPDQAYMLDEVRLPNLLCQVSVVLDDADEAAQIVRKIAEKYSDRLTPLQNERCIDIVPKGVCKAQGMHRVKELFYAQKQDVIVIGDNFNDIDMLKEFFSYAMQNGIDEVKSIATRTVSSVTELIKQEI